MIIDSFRTEDAAPSGPVGAAPTITSPPQILSAIAGTVISFILGPVTGSPTPTNSWQLFANGVGQGVNTNVTAVNTVSYVLTQYAVNGYGSATLSSGAVVSSTIASVLANPVTTARNPVGSGTRYDITDDASFNAVPFGALGADDVVNIFWRSTPYLFKWGMRARAGASNPTIIWGVTDSSGNRPRINFAGAQTALGTNPSLLGMSSSLDTWNSSSAYSLEDYGGIIIRNGTTDAYGTYPDGIHIYNIELYGAQPNGAFSGLPLTMGGARVAKNYINGAASGIRVQTGYNIWVENCWLHDCPWNFFSNVVSGLAFDIPRHITLRCNKWWNGGISGSSTEHNCYIQGNDLLVEGNYFGPLVAGSQGSAYKSRGGGEIFRYNWGESGSRCFDWVEMENQGPSGGGTAGIDWSDYGIKHIYGNVGVVDDNVTSQGATHPFHFGGDKQGEQSLIPYGTTTTPATLFVSPTDAAGKSLYQTLAFVYGNTIIINSGNPVHVWDMNSSTINVKMWNNLVYASDNGSSAYAHGRFAMVERAGIVDSLGGNVVYAAPGCIMEFGVTDGWFSGYTDPSKITDNRTVAWITGNPNLTSVSTQNYQPGSGSSAFSAAVATPSGLPSTFLNLPVQYSPRGRSNGLIARPTVTTSGAFE